MTATIFRITVGLMRTLALLLLPGFLLFASCGGSGGDAIQLKTQPEAAITSLLVVNPVVDAGGRKGIKNLAESEPLNQIEETILGAYKSEPLLEALRETGKTVNSANNQYTYSDLFSAGGQPRAEKIRSLVYDQDKLLVVPLIRITEKRENVNIPGSPYMCPEQSYAIAKLSLQLLDSKGRLVLDSSEVDRDNASVEYYLHGIYWANPGDTQDKDLRLGQSKCGMLYKPRQRFENMFSQLETDYLENLIP
ncbi:MAG: hypothetical protein KDK39_15010 [Leptospiraceae bacterium]|nr:hypothetical protein [Leptospiraceae bacterium]